MNEHNKNNLTDLVDLTTIDVKQGTFVLSGLDIVESRIFEIEQRLSTMTLTEDDIKSAKKLVAWIRKEADQLDTERKQAQKVYMEPVNNVIDQVKHIKRIASLAEEHLRSQIRTFEEKERQEKEDRLRDIFEKRKRKYPYSDLLEFEAFLEPKYLNKSMSMTKAEQAMVDWLEQRKSDIKALEATFDGEDLENALSVYFENSWIDLRTTLKVMADNKRSKEKVKQASVNTKTKKLKPSQNEPYFKIVQLAVNENDYDRMIMLLDNSNIDYKII